MKGGLLLNKFFKGIGFYLVIFIIIVGIVQFSGKPTQKVETLEFSKVYRELTNENISRLYFVSDTTVEGTIKDSNTKFRSYVPKEIMGDTLSKEVLDQAKEANRNHHLFLLHDDGTTRRRRWRWRPCHELW